MTDIRKNEDGDVGKVVCRGVFGVPWIHWLFLASFISLVLIGLVLFILAIASTYRGFEEIGAIGAIFAVLGIVGIVCLALVIRAIKKSSLIVNEKMISGNYAFIFSSKRFSYRLDQIDNVELMNQFGGFKKLVLNFTNGSMTNTNSAPRFGRMNAMGGAGVLPSIPYLRNGDEVYEALSSFILNKKTDKDVQAEIAVMNVEAQNRQAAAIESLAGANSVSHEDSHSVSYIDELEKLKNLADKGVISQEEYAAQKKKILEKN